MEIIGNNIMDIKEYLLGLEGVNPEMLDQSLVRHYASISDLTVADLADRVSIYANYGMSVVNKELGGIVDFKLLSRSPEEIIDYCEAKARDEADGYGGRSAA